jgi:hypothetical protein
MAETQALADSTGEGTNRGLADVYSTRGQVLLVRGEADAARDCFRKGLRYLPRDEWTGLSELFLRQYPLGKSLDEQFRSTQQIVPPIAPATQAVESHR